MLSALVERCANIGLRLCSLVPWQGNVSHCEVISCPVGRRGLRQWGLRKLGVVQPTDAQKGGWDASETGSVRSRDSLPDPGEQGVVGRALFEVLQA